MSKLSQTLLNKSVKVIISLDLFTWLYEWGMKTWHGKWNTHKESTRSTQWKEKTPMWRGVSCYSLDGLKKGDLP